MNRFFSKKLLAGFALALVVSSGALSPLSFLLGKNVGVQIASAQFVGGPGPVPTDGTTYAGPGGGPGGQGAETGSGSGGTGTGSTNGSTTPTPNDPDSLACDWYDIVCGLVKVIAFGIGYIPNMFATVSGVLLDFTLHTTIQDSSYNSDFAVTGWKLVRDFTNLLFIFALFVIAFNLIFDVNGMKLNPGRTFARVIIMALLVNFSFFFARSLISITNIAAGFFYDKISTSSEDAAKTIARNSNSASPILNYSNIASVYAKDTHVESVSLSIVNLINPQELILHSGLPASTNDDGFYISYLFISFMAGLFNVFLTLMFLAVMILMVGRTFGLIFGAILSPFAFVSWTIPSLQKMEYFGFDDWMTQFLGLCFTAPVFMFFLYLTIMFLNSTVSAMGAAFGAAGANTLLIVIEVSAKLAAVAFVLVLSYMVTKKLSGKIGALANKAIVGAATGAALVGATAATGGIAAVGELGANYAKNKAISVASNVGSRVTGENVEQIQARLRSGNYKSFAQMNPRRALVRGAAALTGSETPKQLDSALRTGARLGTRYGNKDYDKVLERTDRFKKIREQKNKDLAQVDRLIEQSKQTYNKSGQTAADKVKFEKELSDLEGQKKKINAGTVNSADQKKESATVNNTTNVAAGPTPTTTPPPNNPPAGQGVRPNNNGTFTPGTTQLQPRTQPEQTPAGETATRPKNTFNGDVKFDRPKEETAPISNQNAGGQALQSYLTGQRVQKADQAENGTDAKFNNVTIKNLKIAPTTTLPAPIQAATEATSAGRATNLLSAIQSGPIVPTRVTTAGVENYTPERFASKKPIPAIEPEETISATQNTSRNLGNNFNGSLPATGEDTKL